MSASDIEFKASNYRTITNVSGRVRILQGEKNMLENFNFLNDADLDALAEYLQHKRDVELGRWRWPENPDYVVYRVLDAVGTDTDDVRVVAESTGCSYGKFSRRGRYSGVAGSAANAYFAAHPEPKPWHDAKPGEVWEVDVADPLIGNRAMPVFLDDSGPIESLFFGFWNGPDADAIAIESSDISIARRIYPEGEGK